jgi:melibiose permease/lactose/raffinose/galactose permease
MQPSAKRNQWCFGLGTIGRDMLYSLVSMYLIYYLTDILELSTQALWWITGILLFARVYDAVDDPVMGFLVDNTNSKYGKFKPWIAIGAVVSGIFTILIFTDLGLTGTKYIVCFAVIYILWGISFTVNDISYWSLLPSLSIDQKEREKIGAIARICANIGLFTIVVLIIPITTALGKVLHSPQKGFFVFSILVVGIMWIGQCITLFGVKESKKVYVKEEHTSLKDMVNAIFKNDQLLFTAISMALFMIGYMTTTSFGIYYFKYAYGNEDMYSVFAIILGLSQIAALIVFPAFSKRFERKILYTVATVLVVAGYVVFFFAPVNTMRYIGVAGVLIFTGQAFIQLMMLVFLADTVEYGQWKLGKRNDSITFSVQPFINKMGGAIASGIVRGGDYYLRN